MISKIAATKKQQGFTLVELAIVIVIIGVLASFGVPRFRQAVERSKAGEAFAYLASVRSAQERYHAREATYAVLLIDLDIDQPAPKYFSVGAVTSPTLDIEVTWEVALTRSGASAGYGAYTVVFNQDGYDSITSTIIADINPVGGASAGT